MEIVTLSSESTSTSIPIINGKLPKNVYKASQKGLRLTIRPGLGFKLSKELTLT